MPLAQIVIFSWHLGMSFSTCSCGILKGDGQIESLTFSTILHEKGKFRLCSLLMTDERRRFPHQPFSTVLWIFLSSTGYVQFLSEVHFGKKWKNLLFLQGRRKHLALLSVSCNDNFAVTQSVTTQKANCCWESLRACVCCEVCRLSTVHAHTWNHWLPVAPTNANWFQYLSSEEPSRDKNALRGGTFQLCFLGVFFPTFYLSQKMIWRKAKIIVSTFFILDKHTNILDWSAKQFPLTILWILQAEISSFVFQ